MAGLTPAGVLHSWFLGTSVYAAFGCGAYMLVCLYFLLGSAVSMPHGGSLLVSMFCTDVHWQCIKAPVQCVSAVLALLQALPASLSSHKPKKS